MCLQQKKGKEKEELMKYCEYMEYQVSHIVGAIGPSAYAHTQAPKRINLRFFVPGFLAAAYNSLHILATSPHLHI